MTRPWMLSASSAAFVAGMLMVHCSSSSTSTGTGDSGVHPTSGTGSSTGSGTPAGSSTGSGSAVSSGTGTSPGTGSATGTGTGTVGSSTGSGSGTHGGSGSGAPCVGPTGGIACDPGNVECGGSSCAVPGHECCLQGSGTGGACLGVTATCTGNVQECDEKSDCPDNQICCLDVTDISGAFNMKCQTGPTCPSGGVASAQICKTNAECSTGSCSLYSCNGNITEACQSPNAFACTKM